MKFQISLVWRWRLLAPLSMAQKGQFFGYDALAAKGLPPLGAIYTVEVCGPGQSVDLIVTCLDHPAANHTLW